METNRHREGHEPTVAAFLSFLEKDLANHPQRVTTLDDATVAQAVELTRGVATSDDEQIPEDLILP
jgi:antitoxin PrlF